MDRVRSRSRVAWLLVAAWGCTDSDPGPRPIDAGVDAAPSDAGDDGSAPDASDLDASESDASEHDAGPSVPAAFVVSALVGAPGEDGSTATFTVSLATAPTADVTLGVSSDDPSEGSVSPSSLVFTDANWATEQTVTVTGVDDTVLDGDVDWHVVLAPATSADPAYAGLDPADVDATTTDDDAAGFEILPVDGPLCDVAGSTMRYSVRLTATPSADVVLSTSLQGTLATVAPASITFTPANARVPVDVTFAWSGTNVGSDTPLTAAVAVSSTADAAFAALAPAAIPVVLCDAETEAIVVTAVGGGAIPVPLVTTEGGGTASFRVVLSTRPAADVTLALAASDSDEITIGSPSLVFTPMNFATPRTVTLTGRDDGTVDGIVSFSLTLTPTSTDLGYANLGATSVAVCNDSVGQAPDLTAPQARTIQRLVVAILGRPADSAAIDYWASRIQMGASLTSVANAMTSLSEAAGLYGFDDTGFVQAVFRHMFGRTPDPAALQYWVALLSSPGASRGSVVLEMGDTAIGLGGTDGATFTRRITAAGTFTSALDTPAEWAGYVGSAAHACGRTYLAPVTTEASFQSTTTEANVAAYAITCTQ